MKHFTYDEWLKYVRDEINEKIREEFESHLYECDQCLEHYLQAMAEHESSLPVLSNESSFTDLVMVEVLKQSKAQVMPQTNAKPKTKKPFYQQAVFHYMLAAAATLLLMFSGVFQSLANYAGSVEAPTMKEAKPSVTEGVIDKTFAWMDSLEKKEVNKK